MQNEIAASLLNAMGAERGHFIYESGQHGDVWLDLDALFMDARRARGWAAVLAEQAAVCEPDFVCGPLLGGAFFAQLLAAEMGAQFVFAERFVAENKIVRYRIPKSLRPALDGRRVLLVDDAINAGSAMHSTLMDLIDCGAVLAGFASLLTLGEAISRIAGKHGVPLFTLATVERSLWTPETCHLCKAGVPLTNQLAGRDAPDDLRPTAVKLSDKPQP